MIYTKENISTICNVSHETLQDLQVFHDILLKWQKAINLISSNTTKEVWHRHIADSVQLFSHIPTNIKSIVDLGSGGGLPAIVLAILLKNKNIKITMIESDKKKCVFLQECVRTIGLNAIVINDRIEKITEKYDLDFDLVTARALAPTNGLLEFCNKLGVKKCLFLKGKQYAQEISDAKKNWDIVEEIIPSITAADSNIINILNFTKK
ncbi:16S rRNA (guanine(527)-N(7))-methyltransferase RsmG [Alphaproteobacteria bacterium]|nr:16S rRNA (guanine(527)-N(7))-methyltransferase RsmG [Alphaproteobacteria bacterium]